MPEFKPCWVSTRFDCSNGPDLPILNSWFASGYEHPVALRSWLRQPNHGGCGASRKVVLSLTRCGKQFLWVSQGPCNCDLGGHLQIECGAPLPPIKDTNLTARLIDQRDVAPGTLWIGQLAGGAYLSPPPLYRQIGRNLSERYEHV